jgi:hypothetical protein
MIPLFLIGLRFPIRFVHIFSAIAIAGFLTMALLPERWATFYRDLENDRNVVSVGTILMGTMGVCFALLLGATCAILAFKRTLRVRWSATCWFLIGWLVLELLAYYVLTPFAAARRVMGMVVVATLMLGRIFTTNRDPQRGKWMHRYCALGVGIGLVYAWTDYRDAVAEHDALLESIKLVHEQSGDRPRIWFAGHWGFQYYGEREGLQTIYPRESIIEEGDWIIVPDSPPRPYSQTVQLQMPFAAKRGVVEIHDDWPLNTNPIYYDGYMPIRRHDGYRLRVAVYRANERFRAWSD